QARRQIDDRATGRIMRPALIADVSQSGMACGNPDAEAKLVAVPAPFLRQPADPAAHLNGHTHSTRRRIGTGQRIVKNDKKAVPRKMLQGALETVDRITETAIIFLQDRENVFRLRNLRKRSKTAQIAEHRRDFATMAFQ